jgi:hypothetical protein
MKILSKWICGPEGLRCPCCRKGTLRDAKRGAARAARRQGKKAAQEEA